MFSRRDLLWGALATASCGRSPPPPPLTGSLLGHEQAERGHARSTSSLLPSNDRVDVLIVGGGVAGLCAAWRLARAGFRGSVALVELGDTAGGTSIGGSSRFPWGAHYVTLPNRGATLYRALLHEFGVVTGQDSEGRLHFREDMLCHAPQERLFDGQRWVDGQLPSWLSSRDTQEVAEFEALCAHWSARTGDDGLPAFDIPVMGSSRDPSLRSLARISFAQWLQDQGLTGEGVRWLARYAVRDDFGAEPESVSAWAGLHYHCARRPEPAVRDLATHVLTWPEGNAWLVNQLVPRVPWPVTAQCVVRSLVPEEGQVHALISQAGAERALTAQVVIAAIPSRVVARWLPVEVVPDLAPWRVAALFVERLPQSRGVPFAWDSVRYQGRGLGYVSNVHQTVTFRGPAVLSFYDPLSQVTPAEGRRSLLAARWQDEVELVMDDLSPGHPDLREVTTRVDVMHWGHGTAIPAVGLHEHAGWHTSHPHPRVLLAHSDRSGMSLFEEASWHGVHAAERALEVLGIPLTEHLT